LAAVASLAEKDGLRGYGTHGGFFKLLNMHALLAMLAAFPPGLAHFLFPS
jgi:hypothetical protein